MDESTEPKVFISYSHADGQSSVKEFWELLNKFLNTPQRSWEKWDDKEIAVGQEWDGTVRNALNSGCNCCLLLVSDLFGKSSYILDKEWPETLTRFEEKGIVFFPVVFGVLEGGLAALPKDMERFQLYWPSMAELFRPLPESPENQAQMRLCYKDLKRHEAPRDRFLSRLADQMNKRFDKYLRDLESNARFPPQSLQQLSNPQLLTGEDSDDTIAKAMFSSIDYEKRYRDSKSRQEYFSRAIDAMLDEQLRRGEWLLIEGHPLAGKTRAAFEAVKRLVLSGRTVALWRFETPNQKDQRLDPPTFPKADCRIVWLDDVDLKLKDLAKRGYGANEMNRFLEDAADSGLVILATTRTGPTYYDLRHRFGLDDHIWDKLQSFQINRLSGKEEANFRSWFHEAFKEDLPDSFDHNPGSLFLNLEAMGVRWHNMDNIILEHQLKIEADHAKDVLRALHVFYIMEAYRPGGLFAEMDIRYYLRRKAAHSQQSTSLGAALSRAQGFKNSYGYDEWEAIIKFLAQDKYHLGFLRREGDYLVTETAYLDYIVGPDGEKRVARIIDEIFSKEECLKLGLTITRYNFFEASLTKKPLNNKKYLSKLVRQLASLGFEYDIQLWNQLIAICQTYSLARHAFEFLKEKGLRPDDATYNALITKANNIDQIRAILDDMSEAGCKPDIHSFTKMIGYTQDFDIAYSFLTQMEEFGITPNIHVYNCLIGKAGDYQTGRYVLDNMKECGVAPNTYTYVLLLERTENFQTARAIVDEMKALGMPPKPHAYARLIHIAKDYGIGVSIIREMRRLGAMPSRQVYVELLNFVKDYEKAVSVVEDMKSSGIAPNLHIYDKLLDRSYDYETGRAVIDAAQAVGLAPDTTMYNKLIGKTDLYGIRRALIDEMKSVGLTPTTGSYNALLNLIDNYAAAIMVLDEMESLGLTPNAAMYERISFLQRKS